MDMGGYVGHLFSSRTYELGEGGGGGSAAFALPFLPKVAREDVAPIWQDGHGPAQKAVVANLGHQP